MPFDAAVAELPPLPPREPDAVRAIVLYDPIQPHDRTIADLEWAVDKTLAAYLDGLPETGNWVVFAAGRVVPREEWADVTLMADDTIVVSLMPEKGASAILAIVAMIALAVVAPYAAPAIATMIGFEGSLLAASIISATMVAAGGFLISALLPPETPKPGGDDSQSSPSYGLDGAKPTAREDVPLGAAYGLFRIGGNRTNYYSQTSADGLTQDLFLQYAVSDGQIEAITDVLINDQPVSNFKDVEIQTGLGAPDQVPSAWFASTITPYANGAAITETPILYDTQDAVDRVRLDVTFPAGLYTTDQRSGNRSKRAVQLTAFATPLVGGVPTGSSIMFSDRAWIGVALNGSNQLAAGPDFIRLTVRVQGTDPLLSGEGYSCNTTVASGGDTVLNRNETGTLVNNYVAEDQWQVGEKVFTYEVSLDPGAITTVTLTGCTLVTAEAYTPTATIDRNERSAVRVSLDSGALPRGLYQINLRRANAETTSDYAADGCVLAAVNEIIADPVSLRRTAWYGVRVRLTDQLNGEPTTTALVKGRKVWLYDTNGTPIDFVWSNNCADVALDILLSDDWERPLPANRIDFAFFARFRSHCIANNLTFNGVFDYRGSVWDALTTVMRVGRAAPLVSGTRWSGVIEGIDTPIMMFGVQNIEKETFENFWVGREGRSNYIEVQYYDAADKYRRNSVYAIDEDALARGEPIRQASLNLVGVSSRVQAQAEADLQLRMNMGIGQGCRFGSSIEAIGCTVGDLVYVQHDLPKWGWADRIKSVANWPVVDLHRALDPAGLGLPELPTASQMLTEEEDAAVVVEDDANPIDGEGDYGIAFEFEEFVPEVLPMPAGDWRILVLKPAVQEATVTVTAVSGALIMTTGAYAYRMHRLVIGSTDYEVVDQAVVGSETSFRLDRGPGSVVGQSAQLWRTDQMLEGTIALPNQQDREVTVTGWAHGVSVEDGDQVMIGRVGHFKKLFRVTGLSHNGEHSRNLECIEYNPWVYDPHSNAPPANYSEIPASPLQVLNLSAYQESRNVQGGGLAYYAIAAWERPLNDLRGHAGSKVWVSRNGGPFELHETALDGRQASEVAASIGDTIRFRVVAIDRAGFSAPFTGAPIATVTIGARARVPDAPTSLAATGGTRLISVTWTLPVDADVKEVEVWENTVSDLNTAALVEVGYRRFFARSGLLPLATRHYWIRSVSYSGAFSAWVGPVSATTTLLLADDLENGIISAAKFAATLEPITLVTTVPTLKSTSTIFNTTDGKLYRWSGTAYVRSIPAVDILGQLASDQIADLAATKLTGQITETQIADDAITTPKLLAGAVTVGKLAAGSVTTEKLAVGSANLIFNSTCLYDTEGWVGSTFGAIPPAAPLTLDAALAVYPHWVPSDVGGGSAHLAIDAGEVLPADAGFRVYWRPNIDAPGMTVIAGNRYHLAVLLGVHRCTARAQISWRNAAGVEVGITTAAAFVDSTPGGKFDGDFTRSVVIADAPAGAVYARMGFIAFGTGSPHANEGAYVFWTKAVWGEAPAGATEAPIWSPGGVTEISGGQVRTRTLAANRLVANTITADEMAANSVTFGKIAAGAVRAGEIYANEIRASHLITTEALITQAAQMGTLVVDTASIRDLAVDTLQVKNGAITGAVGTTSSIYHSATWVYQQHAAVAAGDAVFGGKFLVMFEVIGTVGQQGFETGEGGSLVYYGLNYAFAVRRNGNTIYTSSSIGGPSAGSFVLDQPGAGIHLYTIAVWSEVPSGSQPVLAAITGSKLVVMQVKR